MYGVTGDRGWKQELERCSCVGKVSGTGEQALEQFSMPQVVN